MNYLKKLCMLLILITTYNASYATHLVGAELSYKPTDTTDIYEVTLIVYRDCQGIQLCANCPNGLSPNCGLSLGIFGNAGACGTTSFGSVTLRIDTSAKINDVIDLCSAQKSICTNCGTRSAGSFNIGVEKYVFRGRVDLRSVPYTCCQVRLSLTNCCRNNSITTINSPGSVNYYTEAILNRCLPEPNTSSQFKSKPLITVCSGVKTSYNAATSNADGDSLVFSLAPALTANNQPVPYTGAYSGNNPFPTAVNGSIQLNTTTGDINFTPSGNFVSNLVIKVEEYAKINQQVVLKGSSFRDIQIYSTTCPASNTNLGINLFNNGILVPDSIKSFEVNLGSTLCLTMVAHKPNNTDTTDIEWIPTEDKLLNSTNANYLYNTLTRSTNGPLQDSMQICFTPTADMVRNAPYLFTMRALDRICPLPNKTYKSFSVKVNGNILSQPQSVSACLGSTQTLSVIADTSTTLPTYQWYKNNTLINGATQNTYNINNVTPNDTGSYWVDVIKNNITQTSNIVKVTLKPSPVAAFIAPTNACKKQPVNFINTTLDSLIIQTVWGFSDSTYSQTQNATKTYEQAGLNYVGLLVVNIFGCFDTVIKPILINEVNTQISVNANTATVAEPLAQYQWYNCDSNWTAVANATSQSFTAQVSGNYAAIVNGICTDTTGCVFLSATTGISQLHKTPIKIYPNPSSGKVWVEPNMHEVIKVNTYQLNGKLIQSADINLKGAFEVNLPEAGGIYLLEIVTNKETIRQRIIKQ